MDLHLRILSLCIIHLHYLNVHFVDFKFGLWKSKLWIYPLRKKKELQDLHIVKKQITEDLSLRLCTLVSLWSQPPKFKALYFLSHLPSKALLLPQAVEIG